MNSIQSCWHPQGMLFSILLLSYSSQNKMGESARFCPLALNFNWHQLMSIFWNRWMWKFDWGLSHSLVIKTGYCWSYGVTTPTNLPHKWGKLYSIIKFNIGIHQIISHLRAFDFVCTSTHPLHMPSADVTLNTHSCIPEVASPWVRYCSLTPNDPACGRWADWKVGQGALIVNKPPLICNLV